MRTSALVEVTSSFLCEMNPLTMFGDKPSDRRIFTRTLRYTRDKEHHFTRSRFCDTGQYKKSIFESLVIMIRHTSKDTLLGK